MPSIEEGIKTAHADRDMKELSALVSQLTGPCQIHGERLQRVIMRALKCDVAQSAEILMEIEEWRKE